MKKPKVSLGPGGFKGLFVQHVEKLVFGIAILFVFVFIFLGYRLESKLAGKTPDKLQELAVNAVRNIERSTFEEVRKERTPRDGKGGQYVARVDIARNPPDPGIYQTSIPWNTPPGKQGSKREDPELFPPIKLETAALTGALCLRSEGTNPLDDLENAPADTERPKRVRNTRKSRGGYGSTMGGYGPGPGGAAGGDMMGGMSDMRGMGSTLPGGTFPYDTGTGDKSDRNKDDRKEKDKKAGPARRYPASKVEGYRPGGASGSMYGSMGSGAMDSGSMGPGMMGPGMMGPGAMGPGAMGPGAMGPGAMGPGAMGPSSMSPGVMGPGAMGPGAMGPGWAANSRGDPDRQVAARHCGKGSGSLPQAGGRIQTIAGRRDWV